MGNRGPRPFDPGVAKWVDGLVEKYDGLCALCLIREADNVDHDHVTGKTRGFLCTACNAALQKCWSDPAWRLRAIEYLDAPRPDLKQREVRRYWNWLAKAKGGQNWKARKRKKLLAAIESGRKKYEETLGRGEEWLDAREASSYSGLPEELLRGQARLGRIPHLMMGSRVFFVKKKLEEWIKENTVHPR